MQEDGWNTIMLGKEERPQVMQQDLLAMVQQLDPDDYDEAVQQFLEEFERGESPENLKRAATLLLQDEVDLAPELKEMDVQPDEKLIGVLLAMGADPDATNAYGEPPLHLAAKYGYVNIAQMLLLAGADPQRHNSRGQLAIELTNNVEVRALLSPSPPAEHTHDEHCSCGHHSGDCHCGHDHCDGDCHCEHDHA